ncbi:hypothetical protein GOP47_0025122 [Adiantum capillus-veneris]|uniref:RecA family profile 1 domain-containing protein n=1 Tax=Adiantum capillus-veneris TaxID=13818 RepID=A0A9D4U434_ADICA|nr:hypothetical protein GOP47_0025122 [Adiantum capillus-veneris]
MSSRGEEGRPLSPSPSLPRLARKCSLGCPILDSFLRGGIPCGSITELVGECGSAKTQICLQLLLSAQMSVSQGGLHASSLYIYTESYFPSKRLQQLAKGFLESGKLGLGQFSSKNKLNHEESAERVGAMANSHYSISEHRHLNAPEMGLDGIDMQNAMNDFLSSNHISSIHERAGNLCYLQNVNADGCLEMHSSIFLPKQEKTGLVNHVDAELKDPCDNVFVQSIQNIEELCVFLDQVPVLLSRPLTMPVRLLIIDSVAALFRSDFDNNAKDLAMRTEWFFKLSSKLKQYAHDYDIAVLVTNQVVDDVDSECLAKPNAVSAMLSGKSGPLISASRRVIPALGIGWSHCVNTRLFLSRTYVPDKQPQSHDQQTGPIKISSERSSNLLKHNVDRRDMVSEPHISVLQRLESELPDDVLLTLPHQRSAQSYNGVIDRPTLLSCGDNKEAGSLSSYSRGQDIHSSRNNWSLNPESFPSCRVRRDLRVVFAPHLPASSCEFAVKATQICGVPQYFQC